jgi:hypothetical protein
MDIAKSALVDSTTTQGSTMAEDDDIAFAAEAAFNAVEAADAEQQRLDESLLSCRICGQGSEEGRPILRFLPVEHDVAAANAAPSVMSFTEDLALHIFCGKTASILPSVNQPELEILTKAGLKNKHGIGPEVNAALARTRCAMVYQEGAKEKHYYLVREFEAHLAAIRHTHINFVSDPATSLGALATSPPDPFSPPHHLPHPYLSTMVNPGRTHLIQDPALTTTDATSSAVILPSHASSSHTSSNTDVSFEPQHPSSTTTKPLPVRAAAGMSQKPGTRQQELIISSSQSHPPTHGVLAMTEDGKVRCGCGGTHWPTGTPRGASSWRNHVMTKRHQKWMEANGLLGAV